MNGRRGVGEATRARILDAAAELGWSPSAPARALGRGRAGAIGLLLARPVETLEVDPFFLRFLAGVERGLAGTDHALLLRVLDHEGPVDPAAYARLAAQGRVDGFLLCDVELEDPRFAVLARRRAARRGRRPSAGSVPVPVRWRPATPRASPPPPRTWSSAATSGSASSAAVDRYEFEQARLEAWRRELARAGLEPGAVAFGDPAAAVDGPAVRAGLHQRRARRGRARRGPRARARRCPATSPLTGFDDCRPRRALLAAADQRADRLRAVRRGRRGGAAGRDRRRSRRPASSLPRPRLVVRASSG